MRDVISNVAADPRVLDAAVLRDISESDQMNTDLERYFNVGRDAVRAIALALLCNRKSDVQSVLDYGCGFGRVTRFLRAMLPASRLVVADVWREGADYCADTFGAEPFYAETNPCDNQLEGEFDLIWAGSVITHLPEARASAMIEFFAEHLAPGGLAVFTTHGRFVHHRRREKLYGYGLEDSTFAEMDGVFTAGGYAFAVYPGKKDYGISLTPPEWCLERIRNNAELRLICMVERGWDLHQDVVAIARRPIHEPWRSM